MNFREYSNQVSTSNRQSIPHLSSLDPQRFIDLLSSLPNGILKTKAVLKVDGFNFKFGKDSSGKFFLESARSGPITDPNKFISYTTSKGGSPESLARSKGYADLFKLLESSSVIKKIPNNIKVDSECLYVPFGKRNGNMITFTSTPYDSSKLGTIATILPFHILDADTGKKSSSEDKVKSILMSSSTSALKFLDPNIKMESGINLSKYINLLRKISTEDIKIMSSRMKADKQKKDELLSKFRKIQESITNFILNHKELKSSLLGDENEGIVLHFNGVEYKITTKKFQEQKRKEKDEAKILKESRTTTQEDSGGVNVVDKKMNQADLIVGRFNPPHNGHYKIINSMTNPVICIVNGKETSKDKNRNPLSVEYRKQLIKEMVSNGTVISSPDGYLPKIIDDLKSKGINVKRVFTGSDRIEGYKDQLNRFNKVSKNSNIDVSFVKTDRMFSASDLRSAIRKGDEKTFKKMIPEKQWNRYEELKSKISLVEEVTGVANVATAPQPIGLLKRNKHGIA